MGLDTLCLDILEKTLAPATVIQQAKVWICLFRIMKFNLNLRTQDEDISKILENTLAHAPATVVHFVIEIYTEVTLTIVRPKTKIESITNNQKHNGTF